MRRLSALSFLVLFLVGTDTFLVAPLLPTLTARFGNDPAVAGWMVSAYAIGYCVMALVAGPLSDRHDRRHVLVLGMALFSVATLACGLAPSFAAMLALRFLTGVFAAVATPQVWAAIPQLVPRERVVAVMAAPTAGLTVAQLAGVPIGSFLAAGSTTLPFVVVASASLALTVALALWFPPVPSRGGEGGALRAYAEVLRTPRALPRFAAYLAFQTGNFAVLSFAATWFATAFGLDATGIGAAMIVLGAGNTVGALLGPRLVRALGQGRLLGVAMTAYLVLDAVVALSPSVQVAVALLGLTFVVGGAVFPVFMNLMQSLTTTARGTVSSLTNVLMYGGSTVAGIVGGPLMAHVAGFWGIAVLALAATGASFALWAVSGSLGREG